MDNGSPYSNVQLSFICGSVGTVLLHTPVRDWASKGKVERSFRTLKERWLYGLDVSQIQSLEEFNRMLSEYIRQHNTTKHGGTGSSPLERYLATNSRIRRPQSREWLEEARKHPFRMYEGERLEDMVESIKEHGVLNPVIVWQEGDRYEMLAGHNRQMAGRLAGLAEIPAIVKTDLMEEDAYVYVIETNVIQRGFAELLPSEKVAVLAERYEKVSSQGRRNDILEEIVRLNGRDTEGTCGHDRAVDKPPNS